MQQRNKKLVLSDTEEEEEKEKEKNMYAIGIDPGYRNFGICIVNLHTMRGNMRIMDLLRGKKKTISQEEIGPLVYEMLWPLRFILANCQYVAIENQPGTGKRAVYAIQCHIESCIRCLFPSLAIYLVSPISAKKFWSINNRIYSERKKGSLFTCMLSVEDRTRAFLAFTISRVGKGGKTIKKVKEDGIEAAQIALYALVHRHKLNTYRIDLDQIQRFPTLEIRAKLHLPPPFPAKKKIKS